MSELQINILDERLLQLLALQHDPTAQQKALVYLDHLKTSEVGWQICMSSLTTGGVHDDRVTFLCFQVIEHFLKNSYSKSSATEQQTVKEFLSRWIQLQCMSRDQAAPSFIRNKAAQIFSLVFLQDYPHRWIHFFIDLIKTLSLGPPAVDNYIRVLKAIDTEVADREILYTREEAERNTVIKNTMRETCVIKLVQSWYEIMQTYEASHPELVSQCLEVVGAYVSWIDISLVANAQFMNLLLHLLRIPMTREAAADCLHDIISKGMEPIDKANLIDELVQMLESEGFLSPLNEDETEFTSKMSRLVNGIGLSLLEAHSKLLKAGQHTEVKRLAHSIDMKVKFMLSFLKNDYDDVSGAVIEFCKEYLHFLKSQEILLENDLQHAQTLLITVAHKMKYDKSYRFDVEGEDEAEFQEFRKQLKVIFDNLVALNKEMVLHYINKVVNEILPEWQVSSLMDVELTITLLYLVGEAIPAVSGNYSTGDQSKILSMLIVLITCGVSAHPHPAVTLQYLETVVRYEKMLLLEPVHVPSLLQTFLDHRGMRNPSCKVRSRCAYLFCKFIKLSKSHIQAFTKDVLAPLQDLLVFYIPQNGGGQDWISQDDQLFLYEAAGVLIVSSSYTVQEKVLAFQELLLPVLDSFNTLLNCMMVERDEKQQEKLAGCLCHAMAITSRTSKAFSPQLTIKNCGCVPLFLKALQVFLSCLEIPIQTSVFQSNVRQFLHRMVVCLEEEILPYIPQATQNLLKSNDIRSIQEYIPLIVQVIAKFKKEVVPFLQQIFVPIVNAISTSLANPIDEYDEETMREKQLLQRNYFQFIAAIVTHDVTEVLASQDSQTIEQVMMSIIHGAVDFPDPVAQKCCFSILRKLVDVWGGKEQSDGFVQFIYKNIIPACFEAPLKSTFDLSDAQTVLALGESGLCMKTIFDRRGDELINYLRTEYLPSLQISPQHTEEYCHALKMDIKVFKNYLKVFFQARS